MTPPDDDLEPHDLAGLLGSYAVALGQDVRLVILLRADHEDPGGFLLGISRSTDMSVDDARAALHLALAALDSEPWETIR